MAFLLALDQGTTSSRAIIFDDGGAIVASAQREFRRRHELTIAKYVLEKWCNSILHGMNHAVFGYRPFLYQTL